MSDTLILNQDANPLSVVPMSIVDWKSAVRLVVTDKVSVVKSYDNWTVRSPSMEMAVPSIIMTTQFIKWKRRVKYNRENIYLRDDYTCQYCLDKPPTNKLTLDHVVPRKHGGKTTWDNMVASCILCNTRKGHNKNIVPKKMPYRPNYYELLKKRQKYPIRIRDPEWKFYLAGWPDELLILTNKR